MKGSKRIIVWLAPVFTVFMLLGHSARAGELTQPTETEQATVPAGDVCPGTMPTRLAVGSQGRVTYNAGQQTQIAGRVYDGPSIFGHLIGQLNQGTLVRILDGPYCDPGQGHSVTLWQFETEAELDYLMGFTVEADASHYFIEPSNDLGPSTPSPQANLIGKGLRPITLWTATSVRELLWLKPHKIDRLNWSPDGRTLMATSSEGNGIWRYDIGHLDDPPRLMTDPGHVIFSIAFSPDGTTLAVGQDDGVVLLLDTVTGIRRNSFQAEADDEVRDVAFSPDGLLLGAITDIHDHANRFWDASIHVWNVQTGQERAQLSATDGLSDGVLAFNPNSRLIAYMDFVAGPDNGTEGGSYVKIWDIGANQLQAIMKSAGDAYATGDELYSLAFSPDGTLLETATGFSALAVWDVQTGKLAFALSGATAMDPVASAAFSPDGSLIATSSNTRGLIVWNIKAKTVLYRRELVTLFPTKEDLSYVDSLAFNPDGTLLATVDRNGGLDGAVRLWGVH